MLIHFDYDGVLVDSFHQLLEISRQIQIEMKCGRPPCAEDLRTIPNLTLEDLGRFIGIPEAQAGHFASQMFQRLREAPHPPEVFPGIPSVLRVLSRTHTIVVITSNARSVVEETLLRNGVDDTVADILDGEMPGSKGDKIRWSLKRWAFEPTRAFMVGDAVSDILAGRNAGVKTVAVTWGFQPRERLLSAQPDFVVNQPQELLDLFRSRGP